MTEESLLDFRNTALDINRLSTAFNVQTKWCVITGASCSGKTTLINLLPEKGFPIVPEAGRKYFERELAKGRTITEIRDNQAAFTRQVYDLMLEHENGLPTEEIHFLDRALPDVEEKFSSLHERFKQEIPTGIRTIQELQGLERQNILLALEQSGWKVSGKQGAAKLLGMNSSTLTSRMKALGISRTK